MGRKSFQHAEPANAHRPGFRQAKQHRCSWLHIHLHVLVIYSPPYIHRMAKNKEMTPTMRARICELHSIGWGYRKIHTRYPQIPVSTIRYTIINENNRDDHTSKPRSGRPPVLSPEQKDLLHKLVTENPHIKMRELQAAVGTSPSKHTVRRILLDRVSQSGQKGQENCNHDG